MFFYKKSLNTVNKYNGSELYEIAYVLTGNLQYAHQLVETSFTSLNYSLFRTNEELLLHNLWKQYKKQPKTDSF
ncbi:MAG: hypothetical protein ABF649_13545, partial [Bacillus sp. (in: firmicutes)]